MFRLCAREQRGRVMKNQVLQDQIREFAKTDDGQESQVNKHFPRAKKSFLVVHSTSWNKLG